MAVERENKPLLGTANVLKQTKNYEKLVRDYGEPAANGLLAKAINNAVSIALAVAIFTTGLPALAATQEECKPQAATRPPSAAGRDQRGREGGYPSL